MLENKEVWKDIKGYEGYQISNYGRVWSAKSQRILKPYQANGYLKIDLTATSGKRKKEYVHRLVALTFIQKPEDYNVVNHIDGNKQNNSADNLEWCSTEYNMQHSYYVLGNTKGCYSSVKCQCIETGKIYDSINEAKRETGAPRISDCCKGTRKTSGGFHWRYVDGNNNAEYK